MTPITKVLAELQELGHAAQCCQPDGFGYVLAVFEYPVDSGRFRGHRFRVGIGFQEDAYPEYPPHWLCVSSLSDNRIPQHSGFTFEGADWRVFSVPPSDVWDSLPTSQKNMKTYLRLHMTRFWDQV